MKTAYLGLLLFVGLFLVLATPASATHDYVNIMGKLFANNTVVFSDGTSWQVSVYGTTPKNVTPATRKYPLPHWMPKPFDGTTATCKMGIIGKNWRGEPICYRRRGR